MRRMVLMRPQLCLGHESSRIIASRQQAMRWKEFVLLRRDPWLISQTLMQLLYLLPPAVLLWRSFSDNAGTLPILTPVAVMAAGQLAGGLAWLTISGEDAPDLVATASVSDLLRPKIEVVLIIVAAVFAPLVIPLIFAFPGQAVVTAIGVFVAALSATAIQLWFRVQARRSQFRRRQTSSRVAIFSEAFVSIGWAATAALALVVPLGATIAGLMTLGVIAFTWKISPDRS
jgi:ABC-2 type transport system permease protein